MMNNNETDESIAGPINCNACKSSRHNFYITTGAMMSADDSSAFTFHRCDTCESVFLINPVQEEKLHSYYTENYLPYRGANAWGVYAPFVEWDDRLLNTKRVNMTLRHVQKTDDIHVLDIGCGKPDFLAKLSSMLKVNAVGVDFKAAQWDDPAYKNCSLIEGDWHTTELNYSFDVITAWHYLEHDYQPLETIEKCYTYLKPGGTLIIEVPLYEGILQKLQRETWQGWHSPRHLTLFSLRSWKKMFPDKQWQIVKHHRYGTLSAFTLWWLGRQERKKITWEGSMQHKFWSLVVWKVLLSPFFLLEKLIPMGVQIIIVRKK
jgi:SAM-dependent methyltransferase